MLSSSTFVVVVVVVVVVISLLQIYGEAYLFCEEATQFQCQNGACIPKSYFCDGYTDCALGEDEVDCECRSRPPIIANMASYAVYRGRYRDDFAPYYVGTTVRYQCKTGYTLEGSSLRCIRSGWSDERPTCVEMCQDEPPSIDHMAEYKVYRKALGWFGQRFRNNYAPYESGSSVEYVCDFNYKLEGLTPRCRNGRWSGRVPTCVVKMCQDEPPSIDHMAGYKVYHKELRWFGQRFRDHYAPYESGSSVEYICDFNYKLEGPASTCRNGRWSGRVPRCVVDFATCGQAGETEKCSILSALGRVHGSDPAAKNAWPWQVLITKRSSNITTSLSNDNVRGGGSIINNRWILTAAHVLMLKNGYWRHHRNLLAFVGISKIPGQYGVVENTTEAYAVEAWVIHNGFSDKTFDNDIALIKVGARLYPGRRTNKGLTFQNHIRPVCLPSSSLKRGHLVAQNLAMPLTEWMNGKEKCQLKELLLKSSAKAIVTGFGHMNQSDVPNYDVSFAEELQQGLLKIEDKATCRTGINRIKAAYGDGLEQLQFTENMICFSSGVNGTNTDACNGDSGGPVVQWLARPVIKGNKKMNQSCWVQIGIVSFGYGCGSDFPGYYTNVARYISWINDTTDGAFQSHIPDCEDGFFYKGRCYFTVMEYYRRYSAAKSLCSSNGGRLADILDKYHQMLVDADVRGKISSDSTYIGTGMKYQDSAKTVRLTDGSQINASTFQWITSYPSGNSVNVKLEVHQEKSNRHNGLYNYYDHNAFGILCRK